MKKEETIRSLWTPTARPLDGARRVAMLLLTTFLLTMTAQTAWAQEEVELQSSDGNVTLEGGHYVVNSNVTISGEIITSGPVHLTISNGAILGVMGGIQGDISIDVQGGTITCPISSSINANTFNMGGGSAEVGQLSFNSGNIQNATITADIIMNEASISGSTINSNSIQASNVTFIGSVVTINYLSLSGAVDFDASSPAVSINVNEYNNAGGTLTISNGSLKDGNANIYTGTIANPSVLNGKTLTYYNASSEITVSLNAQGGSGGTESVTPTSGEAMPTITPPTRTGYTFGGYYTEQNGGGTQYYNADGTSAHVCDLTGTVTLYAKWTANTYTVTLDRQGGSGPASVTATYGSDMPTLNPVPSRIGYEFVGYYTEVNGGGVKYYNANGMGARTWGIDANTTLYAYWKKSLSNSDITIEIPAQPYNGSELTPVVTVYDNDSEVSDEHYTITLPEGRTNAGDYTIGIHAKEGSTEYVGETGATFIISRKAVTITAGSDSRTYDGTALNNNTFTATPLESGDTHTFTVEMTSESTITDVGTQPNVIAKVDDVPVTLDTPNEVGNYLVTIANGTLTVDPKAVTITAGSDSRTYDGTALNKNTFTATPLESGDTHDFTVVMTSESTITDVGTQPNVIAKVDGVAVETGEETIVGNYLVTTVNGTLTINPITENVTVTITEHSNSDKIVYDGKEHTVTGYDVAIDNELYTEDDFTFSGNAEVKGTDAGTYPMELMPEDFTNTNQNFSNVIFIITDGTLTIDKAPLTVTANDRSIFYGNAAANDGVTYSGFVNNEDENVLGGELTYAYSNANGAYGEGNDAPGEYVITPGGLTSNNYEITFELGTLNVNPVFVNVSVTDIANGEDIAGATVQVIDSEGKVVEEWTSTGENHIIEGLKTGSEYTLHETVAPEGYVLPTDDITFNINEEGKVFTNGQEVAVLQVENANTHVEICVVDIADGEEIAGATVQVIDSEGEVVEEWTSTGENHIIEGLKTGSEYTLREPVAPEGYTIPTANTFTIAEDGKVTYNGTTTQVGVLLVENSKTKVIVSVVDIANANGAALVGAHVQVIEKTGESTENVVEEWTSGTENHTIEGLTIYKEYTLCETVAPNGYAAPAACTFTIDETGKVTTTDGTTTTDEEGNTVLVLENPFTVPLFAANSSNLWMTWCDKYDYVKPEGVTVYTVSGVENNTVTLGEESVIPAYTPVLLYREAAGDDAVTATFSAVGTAPASGYDSSSGIVEANLSDNVTLYGNSGDEAYASGSSNNIFAISDFSDTQSYVLRNGNFVAVDKDGGIGAHRCWLNVTKSTTNGARMLGINTGGENTGIETTNFTNPANSSGAWYGIDGRKLDKQPTKKGLYIYNGKKHVIK